VDDGRRLIANWSTLGRVSQIAPYLDLPVLPADFPMPLEQPFTTPQALAAGLTYRDLRRLVEAGLMRRVLKGVLVAAQARDCVELRLAALRHVVPGDCAAVDWTAVWLYTGLLPPNQHLEVPPICLFKRTSGRRLKNPLCISGERAFLESDLVVVSGLAASTPARTAWDMGRLAHRDQAIGLLDALLALNAFTKQELVDGVERFRGMRGVVQLRELAPMADSRSGSMAESTLRLRWVDIGSLPAPVPQVPIVDDTGREIYYLDLGVPELKFACEYDGAEFHSSDEARARDRVRREWIRAQRGWHVEVVRRDNVFGPQRDVERILIEGVRAARRRLGQAGE
jgi:hypothetical protein